jgi:peptidoglycan/xylan/chitin deacetylase (PgdA/CDA1 family)
MFAPHLRLALWLAWPMTAAAQTAASAPDSLRVPILVYHSIHEHEPGRSAASRVFEVTPESFDRQIAYLDEQHIPVVSMQALVDAIEGRGTVPPHAVVITFDDGWENQYVHAFPALRRYGFTATFFVFTHAIGRNDRYFTWAQLREMQGAGMTIGSHTQLHPKIKQLHDPEKLREEIAGSRAILRKQLGTSVDFFAYPFGVATPEAEAAVREAGYHAGRAFPGGTWNSGHTLWSLKAMAITDDFTRFRQIVEPKVATSVAARRRSTK